MYTKNYQDYVLRSLAISRHKLASVHDCPCVKGVSIQLSPLSRDQFRLLGASALLTVLSGRSPCQLFRVNQRSNERLLCGGRVTLRNSKSLAALSSLRTLAFFYSANFRGFQRTSPNKSTSIRPRHLSFFLGARRAFDTGLLGFEDSGIIGHVVISLSNPDASDTLLRGFKIPTYAKV